MPYAQKKDKRHRFQWKFWLDANKDDELLMCEQLDQLKASRQFTVTIRNALRLFFDLSKGNTDVLRELFPGIVSQLTQQQETQENNEFAEIIKQQAAILDRLSRQTPATMSVLPDKLGDDSDLELVTIKKDTTTNSGQNLLNGLMAFAGGTKEEAKETRANFAGAMGDLFAEDSDDIWD